MKKTFALLAGLAVFASAGAGAGPFPDGLHARGGDGQGRPDPLALVFTHPFEPKIHHGLGEAAAVLRDPVPGGERAEEGRPPYPIKPMTWTSLTNKGAVGDDLYRQGRGPRVLPRAGAYWGGEREVLHPAEHQGVHSTWAGSRRLEGPGGASRGDRAAGQAV